MSVWDKFKEFEYEELLEAALHAKENNKVKHQVSWTTRRDGCLIWRDELEEFLNDYYDFVEQE